MNKLINKIMIPDNTLNEKTSTSPWTMLFTMLLLIAGFFMSSILLLNHAYKKRAESPEHSLNPSPAQEKGESFISSFLHIFSGAKGDQDKVQTDNTIQFDKVRNFVVMQGDKIRWPRLKLTGFGTSTDGEEPFAIINGNVVHPGEYEGKVKLVEVRAHDVVVEYLGERKALTVPIED